MSLNKNTPGWAGVFLFGSSVSRILSSCKARRCSFIWATCCQAALAALPPPLLQATILFVYKLVLTYPTFLFDAQEGYPAKVVGGTALHAARDFAVSLCRFPCRLTPKGTFGSRLRRLCSHPWSFLRRELPASLLPAVVLQLIILCTYNASYVAKTIILLSFHKLQNYGWGVSGLSSPHKESHANRHSLLALWG